MGGDRRGEGTVEGANSFARYAAHAAVGCASGEASGSGCGQGAFSAVAGKFASNTWGDAPGKFSIGGLTASVIAGGTASVIGGGKFGNGAITGAFGYLFNQVQSSRRQEQLNNRGWLSGFHDYEVESACHQSVCPLEITKEELRTGPAPGTRIGNTTDIPVLGRVRHIDDSASTLNLTISGEHWLSPGAVSRGAFTSGEYTVIRTYGIGYGLLPRGNELLAPVLWKFQDQIIFDRMRLRSGVR